MRPKGRVYSRVSPPEVSALAAKSQVHCPQCKFPNAPGSTRCLTCKADLSETTRSQDLGRTRTGEDSETPAASGLSRGQSPTARLRPVQGEVVACLWCDPLPPIPLAPDSKVAIGRQAECELVLHHTGISRRHAVISVEGRELRFQDTSSNGSYLNGQRVSSAALRLGDVLTIGPYDIEVQPPEAARGGELEGTQPLHVGLLTTGMLETVPLQVTLQEIEFNAKSGTLTVLAGQLRGALVVVDGRPVTATFGELRDEAAVFGMLGLKQGRFTFQARVAPGERTMTTTLTGLLLEASRQRDEALRT